MTTRRMLSALMALVMMLGCVSSFATAETAAKWTQETTKDGWIKITQEDGKTLGYYPDSGVTIIEVDGYAFKDLDKDGELDIYEDWRLTADERAADLAARLDAEFIACLMTHGDLNGMEMDASNATLAMAPPRSEVEFDPKDADIANSVLPRGYRTFISRLSSMPALQQAKLHNNLQKVAEGLDNGIPILFTTDPRSAYADGTTNLAMAATFALSSSAKCMWIWPIFIAPSVLPRFLDRRLT